MAIFQQGAFQIDPNETPQSIAKKRAMIQQMIMPYGKASNIGEGIAQLFNGIGAGMANRSADKAESAGMASGANARSQIMQSLLGGSSAPKLGGEFPAPPSAPSGQTASAPISATGVDVAKRLQADFGLSPAAAAGFAGNLAHESGNFKTLQEINPTVNGSRGGFGWAQWTGPRRRQYEAFAAENGLDPTSPEANYAFLKHELTNTPEASVIKALQGVNDPAQAAQIVSDKFLRPGIPHMNSRVSKSQQIADMLIGKGNEVQVASLDPSIGVSQAYEAAPPPQPAAQAVNAMAQGGKQPSPAPQPVQMAQSAPQAPQQPAMGIQDAGTPFERMAPQGMDMNTLIQQAQNPWLDDQSRSFVNGLIQQEMQKRDPAYQQQQQMQQLEMQKAQLELQQMQNPAPDTVEVNGRLVDRRTGNVIYEAPAGSTSSNQPSSIQEYEYFSKLDPEQQKRYLAVKRSQQTVDLGTNFAVLDPTNPGQIGAQIPKDIEGKVLAETAAKDKGENLALLNSMKAKMPGLEAVVKELNAIGKEATYTLSGQILNEGRKQLGLAPSDGAVARTQYAAVVANQVLPLLRDTFGAQFTAAEGDRLLATLGDPDVSPAEKEAVLNAFIEQKKRDIEGLAVQTGQQPAQSPQAATSGNLKSKYGLE